MTSETMGSYQHRPDTPPGDHDVTPTSPCSGALEFSSVLEYRRLVGVNEIIGIRSLGEEATKKGILKYV